MRFSKDQDKFRGTEENSKNQDILKDPLSLIETFSDKNLLHFTDKAPSSSFTEY